MSTAECYSPESDRWTSIPSMKFKRVGASAAAHLDIIVVVGGFGNCAGPGVKNSVLDAMEYYTASVNR